MRTRPNKPIRRPRRPGVFDDGTIPTLSLDFLSGVLDSRITFTRSTSGTYYSNGFVTTALTNVPRFQSNPVTGSAQGLLIEGAATNLCLRSAEVRTAWWTPVSLAAEGPSATAPDNTANGDEVVYGSGIGANGSGILSPGITATASTAYALSFYIKPKGTAIHTNVFFRSRLNTNANITGTIHAQFNASTNALSLMSTGWTDTLVYADNAGNGWYRCVLAGTTPAASMNQITISILNASTGNGTDGCYLWGLQAEENAFASSYIPTVESTVARGADSAVMSGSAFSGWYNPSAGTLAAYGQRLTTGTFGRFASINDNTSDESLDLGGSTTGKWVIRDGGSDVADITPGTVVANTPFNIAGAYAANDAQAALGGTLGTADTSLALPTVDRLMIGSQAGTPVYLNGTISQLLYWPTRLPNATLQSLTT